MKPTASSQTEVAGAVVVFTWRGRSVSALKPVLRVLLPARANPRGRLRTPRYLETLEPHTRLFWRQDPSLAICLLDRFLSDHSIDVSARAPLIRIISISSTLGPLLFCHQRTCRSDTPQTMAASLLTFQHATDPDTTRSAPVLRHAGLAFYPRASATPLPCETTEHY